MGAAELAKTEKLNGVNFHTWKRRIMLALTLERLIYVVHQCVPEIKDDSTTEDKKVRDTFLNDDLMAQTIMLAYMEDDLIRVFEDHKTTKTMFEAISQKYDSTSRIHVQLLLDQYNSIKMKESDDIVDHVNKMMVMAKDLACAGNEIPEQMQISTILSSLPPSWRTEVIALRVHFDRLTLGALPTI
ncbi:hypothetical protein QML37_30130, partial [Klebsiella pneumoniae]|uniref:hypothetical protein n=1 Tax=Klebsiella pneumoniae TaxID=573 RepID=UPI003A81144B